MFIMLGINAMPGADVLKSTVCAMRKLIPMAGDEWGEIWRRIAVSSVTMRMSSK